MAEAVLENPDLFDLTMSDEAQPLLDAVKKHIKENVDPITEEYHRLGRRSQRTLGLRRRPARAAGNRQAESKRFWVVELLSTRCRHRRRLKQS
jgi:hypothetical protein